MRIGIGIGLIPAHYSPIIFLNTKEAEPKTAF